jgi:hypothetical protein
VLTVAREIPVTALMDVGGGDEVGAPDDAIARCDDCDRLYRRGGANRCEGGEWV